MDITTCRVCGNNFFKEPLLRYHNMPAVAQFLPDATTLKDDQGVDLQVFQCSGCGLVQLANEPVHYYKNVIRAAGFSEEMKKYRLDQFSNFVKKHSLTGKKAVEIGCGQGEYLEIIAQTGVEAYGVENLDTSVVGCLKKGLKVTQGFVGETGYAIPHGPFDAFFTFHFLEHQPDPNAALLGIYNNLSDDGVGVIEVPNFDMILENNLFLEFMRDHLFYFTKETLKRALETNGFDMIACEELWHGYILSATVKKIKKLDVSAFRQSQTILQQEVDAYVSKFSAKNIAAWGAGHQAFAFFALYNLDKDKIKYIADSAPFKQGKFSPVSHIPIVSPENLATDPVEALIITAGSYSDEIVRIVKEKFNHIKSVAIVREDSLEVKAL